MNIPWRNRAAAVLGRRGAVGITLLLSGSWRLYFPPLLIMNLQSPHGRQGSITRPLGLQTITRNLVCLLLNANSPEEKHLPGQTWLQASLRLGRTRRPGVAPPRVSRPANWGQRLLDSSAGIWTDFEPLSCIWAQSYHSTTAQVPRHII